VGQTNDKKQVKLIGLMDGSNFHSMENLDSLSSSNESNGETM